MNFPVYAQKLSPARVHISRIRIDKIRLIIIKPNILARTDILTATDSLRSIRIVVKHLHNGAARVSDDIGGAEVVGVDVARLCSASSYAASELLFGG